MTLSVREVTAAGLRPRVWEPTLARATTLRLPRRMAGERVLVAAAHADDETLGAGGLIRALAHRGAQFVVVVATDGAAAFGNLPAARRAELAVVRRLEAHAALMELGLREPALHFVDVPDGEAQAHGERITHALAAVGEGCSLWLAPWRGDPHPDHRAVGEAAAKACPGPATLLEYPIWMRHSLHPHEVDRSSLRVLHLSRGQRAAKQFAVRAHTSQVEPWEAGYGAVLPPSVTALFAGGREPFFVEPPR